jgi:hypothetical protein
LVVRNFPEFPVWDGYTSAQLAFVPSVVTNLPALPDWPGRAALNAAAATKAVVASCVVAVPVEAVGAVGTPVKAGEDNVLPEIVLPVIVRDCRDDVAVSAVPLLLTITTLLPFAANVGSLLKPASIWSSSARKAADDPGEFGVGYVV